MRNPEETRPHIRPVLLGRPHNAEVCSVAPQRPLDEKNFADIRRFAAPALFSESRMQIEAER